jgi:N-acetylneuraminic acid mutarotase
MIGKTVFILLPVILVVGCAPKANDEEPPPAPTWQWQRAADYGGPAVDFARAFSIGNRGYAGTGYGPTAAFWQYDPGSNAWTRKADFAGAPRGAAVAFSVGEKGYLGLGYGQSGRLGDFWEYDPQADHWTKKASMPGLPRDHCGAFAIGAKAFVFGGTSGEGASTVYLREVWEYDPSADRWMRKADLPEAVGEPACFVLDGKGYMGTGLYGPDFSQLSQHFWEYDPQGDSWVAKTDFPGAGRYAAVGFSLAGKGYIGTGIASYSESATTPFSDIWEYDPAGSSWTKISDFSGGARGAAVAFVLGSDVYVGTGVNSGAQLLRDVWRGWSGE